MSDVPAAVLEDCQTLAISFFSIYALCDFPAVLNLWPPHVSTGALLEDRS
jgi:hypothetical protein